MFHKKYLNDKKIKSPIFLLIAFMILVGIIWKLNSYIAKEMNSDTKVQHPPISSPAKHENKPPSTNMDSLPPLEPQAQKPAVSSEAAASSSQPPTNQEIYYELPLEDKILVQ